MAKHKWAYLDGEKRVGEYEELTVKSIGHWWAGDRQDWPEELVAGYHLRSPTGVAMVEPTRMVMRDMGAFRDRNKLTYRSYVLQQDLEEKKLDALLEGALQRGAFGGSHLPESIRSKYIPAMRHFWWGAGLSQLYGSTYTPSGTVMNTLLLQVFDSMRHAQRMVELSWKSHAAEGNTIDSRSLWLDWAPVQGLRKFIEYSLTVFDWAESLVAYNYVLLPLFRPLNEALMVSIPEHFGDWATAQFWNRLGEDLKRHEQTGQDFVAAMIKEDPANHAVLQEWIQKWYPLAIDAIEELKPMFDDANAAGCPVTHETTQAAAIDAYAAMLLKAGFGVQSQRSVA